MRIFNVKRPRNFIAPIVTAALLTLTPAVAQAQIVTISSTVHDGYRNDGAIGGFNSYMCGDPLNDAVAENRAFLVFDLGPNTTPIIAASLRLFNPTNGFGSTQGPTEDLTIFDVSTPIANLIAGTGGVAAFNDLGTGTVYAVRTFSTADNNSFIDITLNSAAILALNSSSGQFAFGGAITTLVDPFVGEREEVFRDSSGRVTQLVLTTVPEPSSIVLSCIGLAAAVIRRRRRSSSAGAI